MWRPREATARRRCDDAMVITWRNEADAICDRGHWRASRELRQSAGHRGKAPEEAMFNPTELVIEAFVERLQSGYQRVYGLLEPGYPGILAFIGRTALENIANSEAPYHDV